MMSQQVETFARRLANVVPSLEGTWAQQQRDYGDQAPSAFVRAVAFITVSRYISGIEGLRDELGAVAEFLESEFGARKEIDELIARSFIANLPKADDPRAEALVAIGPKVRAELERQWRGEGIPVPRPTMSFVEHLANAEPAIRSDLQDHIEFYDELFPHLFFGEITAKVVEWVESGEPAALARARTVIDTLEAAYGSNYEVDELIAASFVENLPYDESARPVTDLFGPRLRAEYVRQSSYQA